MLLSGTDVNKVNFRINRLQHHKSPFLSIISHPLSFSLEISSVFQLSQSAVCVVLGSNRPPKMGESRCDLRVQSSAVLRDFADRGYLTDKSS